MIIEVTWRELGIDRDGTRFIDDGRDRTDRRFKGKTKFEPLSDYTVVDLETTGLNPAYNEIIEIGAIRVRDNQEVARYQTLIKPEEKISPFIEQLTGISNEMVENEAPFIEVIPSFLEFLGSDVVVGHNVHFDVNFLYDQSARNGIRFTNNCMDTMRLAKFLFKGFRNYRLRTLVREFKFAKKTEHRAMSDAFLTFQCYEHMLRHAKDAGVIIKPLDSRGIGLLAKDILPAGGLEDPDCALFGQVCVFTGTLERMTRRQAMQLVVDRGGKVADSVTQSVDYLIMGNTDYRKVKDGKSSKLRKAEKMQLEGHDIEIIPEDEFYEILSVERNSDASAS